MSKGDVCLESLNMEMIKAKWPLSQLTFVELVFINKNKSLTPPPTNFVISQFLNQLTRPQIMLAEKPYTEILQSTRKVSSNCITCDYEKQKNDNCLHKS